MAEFKAFPKIARLNRDCIITEKLDGTNACVVVVLACEDDDHNNWTAEVGAYRLYAQSRNRAISPLQDNAGFAKWVKDNAATLVGDLGPGYHYGEWWGQGIQRRYGLDHKRFSLFNTTRWTGAEFATPNLHVVPVLYSGPFRTSITEMLLDQLVLDGSKAAPGFMRPEGIVVYHTAANALFKATVMNDEQPKSKVLAS